MTVNFIEVGRYKQSWTAELKPIDTEIIRHLKGRKVLASRFIDVDMDTGEIIAGLRTVGRFELVPFSSHAGK